MAMQLWRWKRIESTVRQLANRGGWLGWRGEMRPIRVAFNNMARAGNWDGGHKAAIKSTFVGRQWTQCKRLAAGLAKHGKCVLCSARAYKEARLPWPPPETEEDHYLEALDNVPTGNLVHKTWGNLVHKTWRCGSHHGLRDEHAPKVMLEIFVEQDVVETQAFERGISLALDPVVPPPTRECHFHLDSTS